MVCSKVEVACNPRSNIQWCCFCSRFCILFMTSSILGKYVAHAPSLAELQMLLAPDLEMEKKKSRNEFSWVDEVQGKCNPSCKRRRRSLEICCSHSALCPITYFFLLLRTWNKFENIFSPTVLLLFFLHTKQSIINVRRKGLLHYYLGFWNVWCNGLDNSCHILYKTSRHF